jgi:hypothetical protein
MSEDSNEGIYGLIEVKYTRGMQNEKCKIKKVKLPNNPVW